MQIKFPTVESEEQYLNQLYESAILMSKRNGKIIEFYIDALKEDGFNEMIMKYVKNGKPCY